MTALVFVLPLHEKNMPHTLVTGPVSEPVDLADAKLHLRVDTIDEDVLIEGLISAARVSIEAYAGLALINQTWDMVLDAWPGPHGRGSQNPVVNLEMGPVTSIVSVTVEGTLLDAQNYNLAPGLHARLVRTAGASWPEPNAPAAGIIVRLNAGFGASSSTVPRDLRHAILMTVAHWFETREPVSGEGDGLTPTVRGLLAPYRKLRL